MNRLKSFSWENCPKNLSFDEIQNPFLVLNDYNHLGEANDCLNNLDIWQDAVLNYGTYHAGSQGAGEDLLCLYQTALRTFEALFVLNEWVDMGRYFPKVSKEQLRLEKKDWPWFPRKLTSKEAIDPYSVIKSVFKMVELQTLRNYLWEFLRCGLSQGSCDDTFDFDEVNLVFKQIEKLLNIAYVISCRDKLDQSREQV